MPPTPRNTAAYLAALSPERRAGVEAILKAIRTAVPKVEDHFSYGIPGFKLNGRPFLWCAAWAEHYSIYPVSAAMRDVLAAEPREYETSRGTIRFPTNDRLPLALVKRLAKARKSEPAR